jgi:hypothetical protein
MTIFAFFCITGETFDSILTFLVLSIINLLNYDKKMLFFVTIRYVLIKKQCFVEDSLIF